MSKLSNYTLAGIESQLYPYQADFARRRGSKDKQKRKRNLMRAGAIAGAAALGAGAVYGGQKFLQTGTGRKISAKAREMLQGAGRAAEKGRVAVARGVYSGRDAVVRGVYSGRDAVSRGASRAGRAADRVRERVARGAYSAAGRKASPQSTGYPALPPSQWKERLYR